MNYFDTSYLVRLYFEESGSKEVRELRTSEPWACAWLGRIEMQAAFHRMFRERQIERGPLRMLLAQFSEDCQRGEFKWLPFELKLAGGIGEIFKELPRDQFLRSSDAVHLACARRHGYRVIFSNDRNLLAAAKYFGLQGRNVIPVSR